MKDIKVKLDGKSLNSWTEFMLFAFYVPKSNKEKQIKVFPTTDEWGVDLTTVKTDTLLPTSRSCYGGREFKIRKYVFVQNKNGVSEIVFTDSKRKFEKFVNSRTIDENNFLNSLKKNSKKHLN